MKTAFRVFMAMVVMASVLAGSPVHAKKKPDPAQNSWVGSNRFQQTFNFRMPNRDIVILKTPYMFSKIVRVQIRRNGQDKPGDALTTNLLSANEVAAPQSVLRDAPDPIQNLMKPHPLADSNGPLKILIFKGGNGLLVVGQINSISPAAYFTHFIPNAKAGAIPRADLAYVLPPADGTFVSQANVVDVGLRLGYGDGTVVNETISVSTEKRDVPSMAVLREPREGDKPFMAVTMTKSGFDVPAELRPQIASATMGKVGGQAVGVEKLRENRTELTKFRESIESQIFGQESAVDKIVKARRDILTGGYKKPKVLVFVGVPGSGKSFAGEAIANAIGAPYYIIQGNKYGAHLGSLDHHTLLGANGSPPQEGELITFLRTLQPNQEAVLQIDEGDKMNPEVWKLLMEFLNKGIIKDRTGQIIEHVKLTIIVTSNRGARKMFPVSAKDWSEEDIKRRMDSLSTETLKSYATEKDGLEDKFVLPDELLSRVDELIAFGPFTKKSALKVVKMAYAKLVAEFQQEHLVGLSIDESALERLVLSKWNPRDDGRAIVRRTESAVNDILEIALDELNIQNGEKISVSIDSSDIRKEEYKITVEGPTKTRSMTWSIFVPVSMDPLINLEWGKRLRNLKTSMQDRVIGQDAALDFVAKSTKSHAMLMEGPNVIGLLGPSGNGKTETARALADALYSGHLAILSMGEIGDVGDFESKFGGAASRQGGDQIREFEQALRNNPDGAVIVLDEITNMGGQQPQLRAALMMRLYGILDIGEYTSPIDGRKYDLKKYSFVLTGNALEEAFLNVSSDDILKANWQALRGQETIQEHLLKMGLPNAFINRVSWNLMKPLLSNEVYGVTKKLWSIPVSIFESRYKGLKITTSDTFYDRLSNTFFRASKGGRSLRDTLFKNIPGLLLDVMQESGLDTTDLRGVEVKMDLVDNSAKRPYITDKTPDRVVTFEAAVLKDGVRLNTLSIDVTSEAAEQVLLKAKSAREVSFHEMGHAAFDGLSASQLRALGFKVDRLSDITGEQLKYVTIRGGKMGQLKYYGYARSEPIKGAMLNPNHDRALITIAKLWAGSKAQQLAGYPVDAGWSNDVEKIRTVATRYLTTYGLDREFVGLGVNKDGSPIIPANLQARFGERLKELMDAGEALAEKVVRMRWDFIRSGTAELMRKGEITIGRINKIDAALEAKRAAALATGKVAVDPRLRPKQPAPNAVEGGDLYKERKFVGELMAEAAKIPPRSIGFHAPKVKPATCEALF